MTVSAGPADQGGIVEITVRDPGVRMSSEELERAFTEWAQGDESDTRSFGGLGLGLALVQRVAERHGGRVVAQTAPGQGSKFSILLPAAPAGRRPVPPSPNGSGEPGDGHDPTPLRT